MKKLVKFTTKEVVKEIEKEIELPAYFIYGTGKPSDGDGIYFNVVKVADPESDAESIQAPFGFGYPFFTYSRSPWTPAEIVSNDRFTQVDKSEWDIAVDMLIEGIKKEGDPENKGLNLGAPISQMTEETAKKMIKVLKKISNEKDKGSR